MPKSAIKHNAKQAKRKPESRKNNPKHETFGVKLPKGWIVTWLRPAAKQRKMTLAGFARDLFAKGAAGVLGKKPPVVPPFPRGRRSPYADAAAKAGLSVTEWRKRELARASGR